MSKSLSSMPFLPFQCRSTGGYCWEKGKEVRRIGVDLNFFELVWCSHGSGEVSLCGKKYIMRINDVIVIPPNEECTFYALSDEWMYHWCTLRGTLAASVIMAYNLPHHIVRAGHCPIEKFKILETELFNQDVGSQSMTGIKALELFVMAGSGERAEFRELDVVESVIRFIDENYADASLSIQGIAKKFGLHRTTLTRRFTENKKRSPQNYLLSIRAENALAMLKNTRLTVSEIADRCGVPNPVRFYTMIKRTTGLSPVQYRKSEIRNSAQE